MLLRFSVKGPVPFGHELLGEGCGDPDFRGAVVSAGLEKKYRVASRQTFSDYTARRAGSHNDEVVHGHT